MATDTVAPWAETAPLTSEILQLMPDDGWRYELVQGVPCVLPGLTIQVRDIFA